MWRSWKRTWSAVLAGAFGIAVAAALAASAHARSEEFPNRTITFVCPFPAGGGTDALVRLLAAELQDKLRRPVIVENKAGAGTQIAAGAVAKAPADGYTLLLAPASTLAIAPATYKKLPYDPVKDFAPVGLVGSPQFALLANATLGAASLPDLIALIKGKNGLLSYGSSGIGTPHHLLMEMFLKMVGAKAQHVPIVAPYPR
jgi:tripartite-type tricarboxylate transporter receptor subunit TctC